MFYNKTLFVVYTISLLDLFAVGVTVPLIGSHLRSLGASHTVIGLVQSSYSLLQVVWGPFFGSLSDAKDRRSVLVSTMLICTAAYFLLGLCNSIFLFFLMRVVLGTVKHTQSLCKAVIADSVPESKHAEALGFSNGLSSLSFVVGPLIGGYLSEHHHGFFLVCSLTSLVFLCNTGLALHLPSDLKKTKLLIKSKKYNDYWKIKDDITSAFNGMRDISWKIYWDAFLLRLLFGLSTSIYFSSQSLYVMEKFDLSQRYIGMTISFFGFIGVISSIALGYITKLFYTSDLSCSKRILHGFSLMTMALFGLYTASNLISFLVILIPYSISSTVVRIVTMELLLHRSMEDDKKGCLAGVSNSIMSAARLVTPITSGLLGDIFGHQAVILSAIVPAVAGSIMALTLNNAKEKIKAS